MKMMSSGNVRNSFIMFQISTVVARLNKNFAALFVFRLSSNKTIYLLI